MYAGLERYVSETLSPRMPVAIFSRANGGPRLNHSDALWVFSEASATIKTSHCTVSQERAKAVPLVHPDQLEAGNDEDQAKRALDGRYREAYADDRTDDRAD